MLAVVRVGTPATSDPAARQPPGDCAGFLIRAPRPDELRDQIDREDPGQPPAATRTPRTGCPGESEDGLTNTITGATASLCKSALDPNAYAASYRLGTGAG
jgi:hypothetical protein